MIDMKKNFFCWVLLCSFMTVSAQTYVKQGNKVVATDVDSVTYSVPASVVPAGALPGLFSVSAEKQVRFSMGNLQYTQSTGTWSFAEHQYDMIGIDNITGGIATSDPNHVFGDSRLGIDFGGIAALADKIDLFGWSVSIGSAKGGIDIYGDYSGEFADWGQNAISNGGNKVTQWRTLTYDEWEYLIKKRPNASSLWGVASVDGVTGLVLLPDGWKQPDDVSFKSGFASEESVRAYADYQTFYLWIWRTLEQAGAVFLPASGSRDGMDVYLVGSHGFYWSATPSNEDYARSLYFRSDLADIGDDYRYGGRAVRLVLDAK